MFTIYDKLGGKEAAFDVIEAARPHFDKFSARPTEHAEAVWKRTGRLPATIAQILMTECDKRGIEYTMADFRISATEAA